MATNKTLETNDSVADFLSLIDNEIKRADCFKIAALMAGKTGLEPKMWGPAIVGFGSYHYKYESGREGDAPLIGFSPRKNAITLYLTSNFPEKEELLKHFGKHKISKACIYIGKLADINIDVLKQMIICSVAHVKQKNYI